MNLFRDKPFKTNADLAANQDTRSVSARRIWHIVRARQAQRRQATPQEPGDGLLSRRQGKVAGMAPFPPGHPRRPLVELGGDVIEPYQGWRQGQRVKEEITDSTIEYKRYSSLERLHNTINIH
jgi:hypothetical protein